MSDGSSLTQISECGSDQVVTVDSIGTTSDSNSEDSNSDCSSSDSDSESCASPEPQPLSIDISVVDPADDQKTPVGERIAKDTGCCLYSAITALFVMVVLLGIVLIVTGPVLGLSFPPLMRTLPPLPPLEHNYLQVNQSEFINNNEEVHDYHDYHESSYHSGGSNDSSHHLPAEYDDYHDDVLGPSTAKLNSTDEGISANETTEDLANLSPEALRLNPKYVAYVPIPIKDDEFGEIEIDDDIDDAGTDREDDDESYDDHYDEVTPRPSSVRRRPSANVDKVLLPILMVPAGSSRDGERTKTRHGSDSWGSNEFSDSPPPRRFDEEAAMDGHFDDEEHLTSLPSRRVPDMAAERIRQRMRNGGSRRKGPGIDFRMFGSLAPDRNRHRYRNRGGPRDDFGRTTSLYPHRVMPASRSRNNKGNRFVEDRETRNGPSLYIRPPPRPRPRPLQPQTRHYQPTPNAWAPPGHSLERQRNIRPTTTSRPGYSYPRDAMSIQDIISYMTSLGHASESTTKQPPPSDGRVVWSSDAHQLNHPAGRSRVGESYPNVLPPPTQTADSRQLDYSHLQPVRSTGSTANPYSFKLDVYPIRDGASSSNVDSYRSQSGSSYRNRPSQSYRQSSSQDYRTQYYNSRQPSGDSSATLGDIDYSYKIRYPEETNNNNKYNSDPYRTRRPYGNYDDQTNYRDEMPVPLVFRRPSSSARDETTTPKPKLVVHLNVFNQKGNGNNRYADDRHDEEEDYYSPSDVYRAVLRNSGAKGDHEAGGDDMRDDTMPSGQNQISTYTHHHMGTDGGSSSHIGQDNLYDNHNMAPSQTDHYYRTIRVPVPKSSGGASKSDSGSIGNYRLSHQSRNFYSPDDVPEPLPMPMAVSAGQSNSDACNSGVNCATFPAGQVPAQQSSTSTVTAADVQTGAPPPS